MTPVEFNLFRVKYPSLVYEQIVYSNFRQSLVSRSLIGTTMEGESDTLDSGDWNHIIIGAESAA